MNLYIWEYMGGVTDSYHDGGGVVIISDKPAREAWDDFLPNWKEGNRWEDPDSTIKVPDTEEPRVVVFEDSGCC